MFTVASDVSEAQRERETHKNSVRRIVLHAEELDGKPVTPRERTRQQHEQNICRGRLR